MTSHAGNALDDPEFSFCMHCDRFVVPDPAGGYIHYDAVRDVEFKECRDRYGRVTGFEAKPAVSLAGPAPGEERVSGTAPLAESVGPGAGLHRHRAP